MVFKRFKDACGVCYYKTVDEKFLIINEGSFWTVLEFDGNSSTPGYVWEGYTVIWRGLETLKDAKGFVREVLASESCH